MIIIGCSLGKNDITGEAREVYKGRFFASHKQYCEYFYGDQYYIMSAKYGVIPATDIISSYDMKANKKTVIPKNKIPNNCMVLLSDGYLALLRKTYPNHTFITPLHDNNIRVMGMIQKALNDSIDADTPVDMLSDYVRYQPFETTDEETIQFIIDRGYQNKAPNWIYTQIRFTEGMSGSISRTTRLLKDIPKNTLDSLLINNTAGEEE